MPKCIYTGVEFTAASAEHILQNSLGARWTSSTIVCNEAQKLFGETIDVALAKQFDVIRNLFALRSGRSDEPPTLKGLPLKSGEVINLEPGGKPNLNCPIVSVTTKNDGSSDIHIELGHKGQMGWALYELKKKIPADQLPEHLGSLTQSKESYLQDPVKLRFSFGSKEPLRAILKAAFNFAAVAGVSVHDPCFNLAREFVLQGQGNSWDFIRFAGEDIFEPETKLGPIDHFIGVAVRNTSVDLFIRLFGVVQYVARLTSDYQGPQMQAGYVVNPLRQPEPAETRSPQFNPENFPFFENQPDAPDEPAWAVLHKRLSAAVEEFFSRARNALISKILEETMLGKVPTPELINEVIQKIVLAVSRLPSSTALD
jgi:hypothetical protein